MSIGNQNKEIKKEKKLGREIICTLKRILFSFKFEIVFLKIYTDFCFFTIPFRLQLTWQMWDPLKMKLLANFDFLREKSLEQQ